MLLRISFERSARFIGAAELIDPDHIYRLATISTPNGLHTFPTCDGEPVVLDPKGVRNTPRVAPSTTDNATRRLRIQRLIGTDETKGVRGDLGRARRAKELGHTAWVHGEPIDDAIAMYEKALARYQATLDELDTENEDNEGGARNGSCARPMVLTPTQAIDWIADLARARVDSMPKMLRHVNRGHRAMRAALLMLPICIGDAPAVALVLALAEREARDYGIPAVKVVHSTARALDSIDRLAAERSSTTTRNFNPLALALGVLNDKDLQSWLGAVTRVGGRILGGAGVEVLKSQLASVGVSQPILSAFEKELNREGLTLGALSKPSPMPGSLDAMTPQALAGRWLAQKL